MGKELGVEEKKLHIAMLPWLAFGHIIPYLELAKVIAQKGHKVSFISTPRNIDRLPLNLSKSITYVKLPLPYFHGLPSNAEATSDLPLEKAPILKKSFDLLREPMAQFLETARPDWILFDFAAYWIPEMAHSLGIKSSYFCTFPASVLGSTGTHDEYQQTMKDFAESHHGTTHKDDVSVFHRFWSSFRGCDAVTIRSCWELERDYLTLLVDILKKPVIPVGQLPPQVSNDEGDDTWQNIKGWLEKKETSSVVYVAFGSEAEWSDAELEEIALGLELSGLPFFWALKARPGSEARLPEGFEKRVEKQGYICLGWVPQVKILAHKAVGAFLSHSGWSSVVEGLQSSTPLVLLPFANDQSMTLMLLESKKMGIRVTRDEKDGSFTRDAVAESLSTIVRREEGEIYREKAKEACSIFGDKEVNDKYVDEFLHFLIYTSQ